MELRIENDPIDITSSSEPDPDWSYTDKQGHSHRWIGNVFPPTLVKVVDSPSDDEYPERAHHECVICQETVEPGYRSPSWKQYAAGATRYYIDDRQVNEDDYKRALEEQSC
ncbi:hypothetical protein LCGC14_2055670 [marine sediment metagenome]|uniref:Uncharacterized protein n=1 Tax=marine sediment metagenome TaxID=412755 RepID=A0A0F9EMU8_9ZZZZ